MLVHQHGFPKSLKRDPWTSIIFDSVKINSLVDLNWNIDLERVKNLTQNKNLIINCAMDPMSRFEEHVVEFLLPVTENFLVLSGNVNHYKNPKSHLCYVPFWFLSQQPHEILNIQHTVARKYKLSCLNGRSRYHRVENYAKLKSRWYFKDLLFVMHNNFDRDQEKKEAPNSSDQNIDDVWNETYVEDFLLDTKLFDLPYTNDHTIYHPAYTDTYVNYVTESSAKPDILFLSEKSWKPFMAGQFAIWLGNPGTVEFLRSIGFDMFDDIIDHSYDQENDFHLRVMLLHQTIDKLMTLDFEKLFVATQKRRLYNQELFYSDSLKNLLTKQIKNYESKISII